MPFQTFLNGQICRNGELVEDRLVISQETGLIIGKQGHQSFIGGDAVDLEENIIAPGYLNLQAYGSHGQVFSEYQSDQQYMMNLERSSKHFASTGVTGFYATFQALTPEAYRKILPHLSPRSFDSSASLLGAHIVDNPFSPSSAPLEIAYDERNLRDSVKLLTMAPQLDHPWDLIGRLKSVYDIRVSFGHSSPGYDRIIREGVQSRGVSGLSQVFTPTHPSPEQAEGLGGLITGNEHDPYFTTAINEHLKNLSSLRRVFQANSRKCILVTDSMESSGALSETKRTMDQAIRDFMKHTECSPAQAVRCATENVVDWMGLEDRGKIEAGRRADFVVLNDDGELLQTWISGTKVWES